MKTFLPLALLPLIAAAAPAADPYAWLEDIEGARALDQVKAWNAETEAALTRDPRFQQDRARAREILDDEAQIADPDAVLGQQVTNLWRDARNPRGLWRVSPLADYRAGKPQWRTLIDVDALGKAEGKSWVWHGASCLEPAYTRCLVKLSNGGTDAQVVREFDTGTGRFVEGGFVVPEAKNDAAWVDRDTLLVATDWGAGSLTESGYPRIVKRWKRGTPLAAARQVHESPVTAVEVTPLAFVDATRRWPMISVGRSFFDRAMLLGTDDGRFVPLGLPRNADVMDVIDGRVVARLSQPALGFPAGALVAWSLADIAAGRRATPELVLAPTEHQAIEEAGASDRVLWVKLLDDVSGKLLALRRGVDGTWAPRAVSLPGNSTVHLSTQVGASDETFVSVEGMLTPPTLYVAGERGAPRVVQSLPARFDASRFAVTQRFATSRDGTRVPYFLVTKKGAAAPAPALIHAYGGFKLAQTPTYLTGQPYRAGPLALFWVEQGGAYVLANLRGGGEYGPRWHQAGLREKRQNVYDDLHAVAEGLVRTGVSAKKKIAVSGRSNGGLLVGVALTQRPDLYGAIIAGSPLEDMRRYSHLSAGASWVDEFGDPDKPADWAFIRRYSPYQNVRDGVRYPPAFFYLSTKDDRVHPGHARKLAALLKAKGNPVYFHEYLEGGHAVGADHAEDANRAALLDAFLRRALMGK
ncbi:prolyl oligopeptidase family serine peptidase [Sphingomonas sp. RHCKR7]|uniref:prolyl oligopeptidase family serine peptidase n=1 Tax=Sphingomonas folli TaxID=2862497 RepID=UPI001CA4E6DC|nr:prolyl oligopeptidase family serine peptidase [Sphingomonas folli]MBW6526042.1 prolyl oligopeptidase family serine peptidase [Sphingomonas folli]